MATPHRFTPQSWQDQQRLLAAGQDTEDLGTALLLLVFGVAVVGFLALVLYVLWGIFH